MNSGFYGFPIETNKIVSSASYATSASYTTSASYAISTSYATNTLSASYVPKSYKVYTALLTQSGLSDPQSISSGAVIQGVTYYIDGADLDSDFSNVGGPPIGTGDNTYFVAINSNVPNNYGAANLTYNNGTPVVTVLENTIGNIWFTYQNTGNYEINSNHLFIENKTAIFTIPSVDSTTPTWITTKWISDNQLYLSQFDSSGTLLNDIISPSTLEIRVYN